MLGLLLAQERLDFVPCLGSDNHREPVGLGRLVLGSLDFDNVAVVQHVADGRRTAVDLAADTGGAERGVDVERKIEQRGPLGQLAQVAVGREDENLARSGLGVETLGQRMGGVLHQLAQAAEPHFAGLRPLVDPLITPMGGDTALGHSVHALGAYLHLDPAALGRDGGVERFVAVGLGDGNPVAHALGVGRIEIGDNRISRPAQLFLLLARAVDDDAQGEDVVDPLERYVLLLHLGPDGENRLGAALDMVLDPEFLQPLLDRYKEPRNESPALVGALFELGDDMFVILGLQILEGDVLKLAFDAVQTELMGNLRIEVHGLPALLAPLLAGKDVERAHHLQTVGELDEDDARVLGIADNQVAEIVGLFFGNLEPQGRDVGEPDGDAEATAELRPNPTSEMTMEATATAWSSIGLPS